MENEISLHELIEKYDFSELNVAQQQSVLLEITADEYEAYRKAIALTDTYFENEPVLMSEDIVAPRVKKNSTLFRFVNYKLPVYKIAALLVLVLSIEHLIPEQMTQETQLKGISGVVVPDTNLFLAYNKYTSNNSIKYNTGLSRVYN
jgi:hypothetical protein